LRKITILGAVALFACLASSSFGASIYDTCTAVTPCSFNGSGSLTVTSAGVISWVTDATGTAPNLFSFTAGTGVFAVIPNGSQEGIANLNNATEPAGNAGFAPQAFITFPVGGLPGLMINKIFPGFDGTAGCGSTAVGAVCTPETAPGVPGPFNFQNTNGGGSTAAFDFSGITADGAATWTAHFTSQFSVPFTSVLAQLASTGSVSNSYSQTTVTITSLTPEPGSLLMIGSGLIGLAAFMRRRRVAK